MINDSKEIFIALRGKSGQMANRWEFPGGKVDEGESETVAIKREMQEEFGVNVNVLEKITTGSFFHNEKKSLLEVYHVVPEHDGIKKRFVLTEHTDYKWIDYKNIPFDNFVDSDLSVYQKVVEFIENKFNK